MCTHHNIMFDSHSCSCVHDTTSCSTPAWTDVYTMQLNVRLPTVLMCRRYIVMFDSHPYWCLHLHRLVRLPSVLICTRHIVMFDSHPCSCAHVTSSCSTATCIYVYTFSIPSIRLGNKIEIWKSLRPAQVIAISNVIRQAMWSIYWACRVDVNFDDTTLMISTLTTRVLSSVNSLKFVCTEIYTRINCPL